MGRNRDAGTDYGDYLTYAQAAQVLQSEFESVAMSFYVARYIEPVRTTR